MSNAAPQSPPPAPTPKPKRRRWAKVLLALFALLLLGVWFAPTVVAKTTLRNRIARTAAADLNGTLEVGGASLGWLSVIELRDMTLTDRQGRVVVRIPKVTSSKTLIGFLRDRSDLGEFTLHSPVVEVVCEKNTTNLEEMIRKYLDDTTPPAPTRAQVAVKVAGGSLALRDADTGKTGEFRDLEAAVSVPSSRAEPVAVKLSASAPGQLDAEIAVGEAGRVKLVSNGFALEALAPLLRRADPQVSATGTLTADVTATWGQDSATIDGTLGATNFALAGPGLNGDTLRLATATLPLKVAVAGRAVRIERADLTSDLGTMSVSGAFDPAEPLDKFLERPGTKFDANIDLAKLAATLPKLLRVREGTELREGKLVVNVASQPTSEGTAWVGNANASALKATRDGRELTWDEPLSVEFAGRFKAGQLPIFDKFVGKSDFIAINAEVKPDSVRAAANVYLDRLAARLADFVDLGGATLDGRGVATLVVRRTPDGAFKADGKLELTQFAFLNQEGKGLREPQLTLQLSASGNAPDGAPVSVAAATLDLTAGSDELRLALLEPISDAEHLASGKLDAKLAGDFGRWRTRVAQFVRIPKHYVMGGTADARGTIRFAKDSINLDRLTLELKNARFRGAGLDLDEPQMSAVADLIVDRRAETTTFDNFTITSAPLSVAKGRLVIAAPATGELVVEGSGPAVTNLNRLGKTLKLFADARDPHILRGQGRGPLHFRYSAGVTAFDGMLDIANFAYGPVAEPAWTEPTLRLEAAGSYSEPADALTFRVAKAERPGLALDTHGSFSKFATTSDVNLTGTLTYDLAKLTPKLRELLGGNFAARGTGSKPIALAGSLAPPVRPGLNTPPGPFAVLTAEVNLGWDSLHAYGFDVGRGELNGKLADGVARVNPIHATFGGGKVTVHPTIQLDPEPGEATFAKGKLVDRAKLTPEVCASALGYAVPVFFKSGKAEGEISIGLGENRIPFGDMNKANVRGELVIHKATVSPGPVVSEVAKLLGTDNVTMTLASETRVPVRVENGRVHHSNFSVKLGGTTIVTSGSVGFDESLDLVADVPIPGGLPGLKNSPLIAKALSGKRVQVPIKGTLAKPTLDPKQFQAAVAKLVRAAAKDVGKEFLNKELEKLFPGMPAPKSGGGLIPFPIPKK